MTIRMRSIVTAVLMLSFIILVNAGTLFHFCETFTFDRLATFTKQLREKPKRAADINPPLLDTPLKINPWQKLFDRVAALPLKRLAGKVESNLNLMVAENRWLIDIYGEVQKIQGKRMIYNDDTYICKTVSGNLNSGGERKKPDDVLQQEARVGFKNVIRWNQLLEKKQIPFLFVQTPSRLPPGTAEVLPGIYAYSNNSIDAQTSVMKDADVPVLDLRQNFLAAGTDWDNLFYRTDHHWRVESGFFATTAVIEQIKNVLNLPEDRIQFLTDLNHYEKVSEPQSFLGSIGTRTGETFSGLDDFVYYVPKFPTHFKRSSIKRAGEPKLFEGTFRECFVFPSHKKFFRYDDTYFGGNIGYQEIDNPEGSGNVLVIHNSMAQAVLPFLALHTKRLVCIDSRYSFTKTVDELLEAEQFDFVISINVGH
ncbi:membrane protein [Planctomycetales bacterium]|nr:membrane protein [Planctomycetales bacterium]